MLKTQCFYAIFAKTGTYQTMDFINYQDSFIPHLSLDCVIFGFHGQQLKVLLPKLKHVDLWTLPGGYVLKNEDIDQAAQRLLEDRTGLKNIYLEQFYTFGKADRNTEQTIKTFLEANDMAIESVSWLFDRFISVGYYALVDFSKVSAKQGFWDDSCDWFDIKTLPNLAFDHAEIIQKALVTLRLNLDSKLVGFSLLPDTFTMKELQTLYETILDKPLRRDNFQRKILGMEILHRIDKKYTGAANKAPYLYRFIDDVVQ